MTDPNFHYPPVQASLYHGQHSGVGQTHVPHFPMVSTQYHMMAQANISTPFMPYPPQYDPTQSLNMPRVQVYQLPQPPYSYGPAMQAGAQMMMQAQSAAPNAPAPQTQQAALLHQPPNGNPPPTLAYSLPYHFAPAGVNIPSVPMYPQAAQQHQPTPPPAHQQSPSPNFNNATAAATIPGKRRRNVLSIVDPSTGKNVINDSTESSAAPVEESKPVVDNSVSAPTSQPIVEVETNQVKVNGVSCNGESLHVNGKVDAPVAHHDDEQTPLLNGDDAAPPSVASPPLSVETSPLSSQHATNPPEEETHADTIVDEMEPALEELEPQESKSPSAPRPMIRYTHAELLSLRKCELSQKRPSLLADIDCVTTFNIQEISEDFTVLNMKAKKVKQGMFVRPPSKMQPGKYMRPPAPPIHEQRIIQLPPKEEVTFREAASTFKHHYHHANEKKDTDQLKRDINSLLNKLTPENFDKINKKILALEIKTMKDLTLLCELIFKKATLEKTYSSTFAKLCAVLKEEFPVPDEANPSRKVTFRGPVIRHCQSQFETPLDQYLENAGAELDKEIAAEADERTRNMMESNRSDKLKLKEDQYFGNMKFIGELIKFGVIKPQVLAYCSKQLMIDSAAALDCLCELYMTVGELVDKNASNDMVIVFDFITQMSQRTDIDSRLRFKLIELIELRERNWKKRVIQEKLQSGPMTLSQLREKTLREQAENEEQIKNMQKASRASSQRVLGGGYAHRVSLTQAKRVDTTLLVMQPPQDISKMQFGPSGNMSRTWAEGSRAPQQYNKRNDNDGWQDSKSGKGRAARQVSHNVSINRSDSPITTSNRFFERQTSCMAKVASSSTTNSGRSTPNIQHQQLDVMNMSTPQLNFLPSSFSAGRGSTPSIPSASAGDLTPNTGRETPRMDSGQLERRVECNLLEYMDTNIFDPLSCVLNVEDQSPYVEIMLSYALEKCDSTKSKAGEFLERMVKEKILSIDSIVAGVNNILALSNELVTDLPNFWQYMGTILERFIVDENSNIAFLAQLKAEDERGMGVMFACLFHTASDRLGHRTVGRVFLSTTSWQSLLPCTDVESYIKQNKLEFTRNLLPRTDSMTPNVLHSALRSLRNPSNEDVFDCIETHMNPSKSSDFITIIADYVFTIASPKGKYEHENFLTRLPILEKCVKETLKQDSRAQHSVDKHILDVLRSLTNIEHPRQTKEAIAEDLETHGVISASAAQEFKSKL